MIGYRIFLLTRIFSTPLSPVMSARANHQRSTPRNKLKYNESTRRLSPISCPPQEPTPLSEPPSLSSFTSDIEEELMAFMDQLDCGIISSTPLSSGTNVSRSHNKRDSLIGLSLPPFELSLTSHETRNGLITPLTSPYNIPRDTCISILQSPHEYMNHLSLTDWGLPEVVIERYHSKGIIQMFPWQAECLSLPGVLAGRNIIYSAPTSAGKTLVAELLSLKCVLENRKKVLMVLPFVSIVREKVNYLRDMFEPVGVKIGGFMGHHSPQGGLIAIDIAVCTIEKANSLINRLIEEGNIHQLGVVVVDELHMVGDRHRGYLLELLLTKLLHITKKASLPVASVDNSFTASRPLCGIQLIGMSATLPNLKTLAQWLNACLYSTDYRPVPLKEMIKIGNTLYDNHFTKIAAISTPHNEKCDNEDERDLVTICQERLTNGHSVLIFCPTKAWCEKLSLNITKYNLTRSGLDHTGLTTICEQLSRTQVGLDPILAKTVPVGVAFHHAGLTLDEREIVEGGFRQILIHILIATSTLSSGVNLPARLVIIRTPVFHRAILDIQAYRQMTGRAGRKGIDNEGESILFCKPSEQAKVTSLLSSSPEPVRSCLNYPSTGVSVIRERDPINRAVLEVIVNGITQLYDDIILYLSCTLLCAELTDAENQKEITDQIKVFVNESLEYLLNHEFVAKRDNKETDCSNERNRDIYYSTQLGSATVASSLTPHEALIVFKEFNKARHSLVLENELHMIYLVTPVSIVNQWPSIDWYKLFCIWDKLPADMKHVGSIVGVQEGFIVRALQGKPPERTPTQKEKLLVHRRFFTCLVLHDLVKETTLCTVSEKYGASKGFLQSLQSASGTFAGMATVFCNRLGWKNLEVLLGQFQSRLVFGIERELCELVNISVLNGSRARILYNNGYHTLSDLANANPSAVETILRKAFPFKSKRYGDIDSARIHWCTRQRKNMSESEVAVLIVQEARQLLSEQLNIPTEAVFWNNGSDVPAVKSNDKVTTPLMTGATRNVRKDLNSRGSRKTEIVSKRLKLEEEKNHLPVNNKTSLYQKGTSSTVAGHGSSLDLFMEIDTCETTSYISPVSLVKHTSSSTISPTISWSDISSQYTFSCSGLTIVHLSADSLLLEMFTRECIKKETIGFSVAVETARNNIGTLLTKSTSSLKGLPAGHEEVMGVAFTWDDSVEVYYLSLCESRTASSINKHGFHCPGVSLSLRMKILSDIFSNNREYKLVGLDLKKQFKYIMASCHVQVTGLSCDPHVADWIIDPDSNEKTLSQLITTYLSRQPIERESVSLSSITLHSPLSYARAAAESILAYKLMVVMERNLNDNELNGAFRRIEMPLISVLVKLELNGIGLSEQRCRSLGDQLKQYLTELEQEAFQYAGRSLSLSSPDDVAKVLFHELKLPSFQTLKDSHHVHHLKTSKEILEKMTSLHPLPKVILEWRRLSNTFTRILNPLLKSFTFHQQLEQYRVHSTCDTHTATGRVILSDPSLQNIPKEYLVRDPPLTPSLDTLSARETTVNMRDVFVSFSSGVFLAADYAQLELRILAHMSRDEKLCEFLNEDGDAFRKISGEWLNIDPVNVSDKQRQHTKQLCYGMIYGIGAKSLGEQLDVSEKDAIQFIETFKSRYSGMSAFMIDTIHECREKGFIKTLLGRKRYIPSVHSINVSEQAHGERQAINSTIQGSASDLVKTAMINIDHVLTDSGLVTYLPATNYQVMTDPLACKETSSLSFSSNNNMVLLIHQLHDELIYEVHEERLEEVARIVQTKMESAIELNVKLPVRLKVGKSWGALKSYEIDYNDREI